MKKRYWLGGGVCGVGVAAFKILSTDPDLEVVEDRLELSNKSEYVVKIVPKVTADVNRVILENQVFNAIETTKNFRGKIF